MRAAPARPLASEQRLPFKDHAKVPRCAGFMDEARLFLILVAGPRARTSDRQPVRRMTDARVPFRLRRRRRLAVRSRRLDVRIVQAVIGVDVRSGGGAMRPHARRSRRPRIGAAGGGAHSGARAGRGSRAAGPSSCRSAGTGSATRAAAACPSSSSATAALSKGRRRKCSTSDRHEDGFADHGSSPWFAGQS